MSRITRNRIATCNQAHVLARAARLFLVWGDRRAADLAHMQKQIVQSRAQRSRAEQARLEAIEAQERANANPFSVSLQLAAMTALEVDYYASGKSNREFRASR